LFAVASIVSEPGVKSGVTTVITLVMAYGSLMAFRSVKHSATTALKFALLLFMSGFVMTFAYRLAFVPAFPSLADISNFLLFGIPAALTVYCRRIEVLDLPNS
jgi:hypothetical protein